MQVEAVCRIAALLPRWEALLVTDRNFTPRAVARAEAYSSSGQPNLDLLSVEQCLDRLTRNRGELRARDEILTYHADIILAGPVTPDVLEKLSRSRHALETALRHGSPRFLEELVAANWKAEGYDVELVRRLNAGGPDVVAVKRGSFVPIKILSSCKWRAEGGSVKKSDVAELLSWVDMIYPANAGLLATNTRLQSGALSLVHRFHRIHAIERDGLIDWTVKLWGAKKDGTG